MRIKGPKLRKKSTSSFEESGIKKDELRNFCEQIKWWKLWRCFHPLNSPMFPKKTFHLPRFEFMKKVSQLVQNHFFFSQKMLKKELNEGYISEKWNESMQKQTCFFRLLTEISINFASKCWPNLQFFTFIKRPITNVSRNFEGWFNFNFYPQVTAYDADWMNNNTKFHHCEI